MPETTFDQNDWRSRYFAGDRKLEVCQRIEALRKDIRSEKPLASTALRFCLSHSAVSTVIPGMRKASHVEDNVAAANQGSLDGQTLERLRHHRWDRNFYI